MTTCIQLSFWWPSDWSVDAGLRLNLKVYARRDVRAYYYNRTTHGEIVTYEDFHTCHTEAVARRIYNDF